MSITDHPGFRQALAESRLLARDVVEIIGAVRAVEERAADWLRAWIDADQAREKSRQERQTDSTAPRPYPQDAVKLASLGARRSQFGNSFSSSTTNMTAEEFMRSQGLADKP